LLEGRGPVAARIGATTVREWLSQLQRDPNPRLIETLLSFSGASPRTFSAAEDFTIDFELMRRGKIIGEPTGGSTGQPLFFPLPGGGSARVCSKQNLYPDGRQFVGVGIQPQILVRPTVADFRASRDTVLEKALEYLQAR